MTHGVMVALLILVQSVKVRIFMGQHKTPQLRGFLFSNSSNPGNVSCLLTPSGKNFYRSKIYNRLFGCVFELTVKSKFKKK